MRSGGISGIADFGNHIPGFDLLACLLEHKGKVLSRSAILNMVWGYAYAGETHTVDVYIRFLRSKLDEVFGFRLIETVRGVGYVIRGN